MVSSLVVVRPSSVRPPSQAFGQHPGLVAELPAPCSFSSASAPAARATGKLRLEDAEAKWRDYGEARNDEPDKIFDGFKQTTYPVAEFEAGLAPIAEALVDTPYDALKGKRVRDIFDGFQHDVADEMRGCIELKI